MRRRFEIAAAIDGTVVAITISKNARGSLVVTMANVRPALQLVYILVKYRVLIDVETLDAGGGADF